jgi:predicted nucleic acid-binding protein
MIANKKIPNKTIFIDTWGWLALGHQRDEYHTEVKEIFLEFRNDNIPIFTSDYVLDELITLIFRRENFNESVRFINRVLSATTAGHLKIERVTSERFISAWELRKRYADKLEISFTDLASMVIMKENGIQSILTMDRHFAQVGLGFILIP